MSNRVMFLAVAWLVNVRGTLGRALRVERGQGLVEYAILIGAISLIAGAALYLADFDFGDMVDEIQACISFESTCG